MVDNPFFQRKTTTQAGCQIDYPIQTRFNMLYACEVKFSKKEITSDIIKEMKDKLNRLTIPKGFASSSILLHVNGVNDSVIESNYFSTIIDFSDLLA